MKAERGASGLSGIIAIDKPAGLTSHDVVNHIRRMSGERRVGHCGTLDPFTTGLLIVCIGPATRLAAHLVAQRKRYTARIAFNVATDTDDCDGTIIETRSLDPKLADQLASQEFARAYLAGLVGMQAQVPPAYSAIKRNGVRAYDAARHGEAVQLEPRIIEIHAAELLAVLEEQSYAGQRSSLFWDIAFEVSKGTYIRALARDIASELGTCGHLAALRRTGSGELGLEDACTLEALEHCEMEACFLDPIHALGLPVYALDEEQHAFVSNGRSFVPSPLAFSPSIVNDSIVACTYGKELLALYRYDEKQAFLRAHVVIPGGVSGPPKARA